MTIQVNNTIIERPYFPSWADPRWRFLLLLTTYVVLGISVMSFNRSIWQVVLTVGVTVALDQIFHSILRRGAPPLFPLSAAISGMGLSILVNYAHSIWLPLVVVFFTILGKYLVTHNGRHVFNPTLLGVTLGLFFGQGMISASPAYQWGGNIAASAFVVTAALFFFVFKIKRTWLMLTFLLAYAVQLGVRAWVTRHHIPPETLFLGALTSPAFYLFTFFMLPDPATSPASRRGQVAMALVIVLVDLLLHFRMSFSTLFFAGSAWFTGRWFWLHGQSLWRERLTYLKRIFAWLPRFALLGALGVVANMAYTQALTQGTVNTDFQLVEVPSSQTGIVGHRDDVIDKLDPRIAHLSKWVLSVGDAAAVADVNNDGLPDLFLTYPLKRSEDRAALYLNLGGFQFKRVALPALDELVKNPTEKGLPSGALWLDIDNDSDQDLLLLVGYGKLRLLENQWAQTGGLVFSDETERWGLLGAHSVDIAANALDWDKDGRLDIITGGGFTGYLSGYDKPTPLNVFKLPQPEYEGDRRMFNFMHQTWHNANNGGGVRLWHNMGRTMSLLDSEGQGIDGHRWTLSIGTADFNGDGWSDLYLANDFGPDQLLINQHNGHWKKVEGSLVGTVGRDTYKGMNASVADFDNNGKNDVYVSNVHHRLQAEGSLLWMNTGVDVKRPENFTDMAMNQNALNEKRFGWGAAVGDIDRDGRIDILQVNGMVDNAYEPGALKNKSCEDYWYWNEKIALTGSEVHGYADRWADLRGLCIFPDELNRVYLNQGNHFIDVARQVGWTQKGVSRAVALADFDNDGDLDVLVTRQFAPVSVYRNDGAPKAWLGVDLVGNGKTCNRDALGTKATLIVGQERFMREQVAANGFSSQSEHRLLWGLGNRSEHQIHLEVDWCGSGLVKSYVLDVGRYHRLAQE